jgi:hypothetical protein
MLLLVFSISLAILLSLSIVVMAVISRLLDNLPLRHCQHASVDRHDLGDGATMSQGRESQNR